MLPSKAFWPATTSPNTVATVILAGTYSDQNDFIAIDRWNNFPLYLQRKYQNYAIEFVNAKNEVVGDIKL